MNEKGHVPIRMCMGCRKRRKKGEMIRFTQGLDGTLSHQKKNDFRGRGFYLCQDLTCFKKAQKSRRFESLESIDHPDLSGSGCLLQ